MKKKHTNTYEKKQQNSRTDKKREMRKTRKTQKKQIVIRIKSTLQLVSSR